jgi:hypothetical protein
MRQKGPVIMMLIVAVPLPELLEAVTLLLTPRSESVEAPRAAGLFHIPLYPYQASVLARRKTPASDASCL